MIGWKLVDEDKDPVVLSSDIRASGWENVLFRIRDMIGSSLVMRWRENASISHRRHPVRVNSPDDGTWVFSSELAGHSR